MLTQVVAPTASAQPALPPTEMLPTVVNEALVSQFSYWDQTIKQGMRYQNELYTHVRSFSIHDRLTAYAIGNELTECGIATCITVSKTHYIVWSSLRSAVPKPAQNLINEIRKF